jgi:hypothetical protein
VASFAGISWEERGRAGGAFLPIHGAKCGFAVLTCPGGTKVFLQILGDDAVPLDVPARMTGAQLASLRTKISTSGPLASAGGSVTATLADIAPEEVKKDVDLYFVVLKFRI